MVQAWSRYIQVVLCPSVHGTDNHLEEQRISAILTQMTMLDFLDAYYNQP
jgi:hypothetical protein